MKVYVLVSNNVDEVVGQIDGVFQDFEDAKDCLEKIKKDWLEWAGDDVVDKQEDSDSFTLETSDEYMDVSIVTRELIESKRLK